MEGLLQICPVQLRSLPIILLSSKRSHSVLCHLLILLSSKRNHSALCHLLMDARHHNMTWLVMHSIWKRWAGRIAWSIPTTSHCTGIMLEEGKIAFGTRNCWSNCFSSQLFFSLFLTLQVLSQCPLQHEFRSNSISGYLILRHSFCSSEIAILMFNKTIICMYSNFSFTIYEFNSERTPSLAAFNWSSWK